MSRRCRRGHVRALQIEIQPDLPVARRVVRRRFAGLVAGGHPARFAESAAGCRDARQRRAHAATVIAGFRLEGFRRRAVGSVRAADHGRHRHEFRQRNQFQRRNSIELSRCERGHGGAMAGADHRQNGHQTSASAMPVDDHEFQKDDPARSGQHGLSRAGAGRIFRRGIERLHSHRAGGRGAENESRSGERLADERARRPAAAGEGFSVASTFRRRI